eukprot:Protomagalhaensia_wolfi_Nauph_80__2706@NODE_2839_length_972_cov_16_638800_g2227_i0_p1_GENE_NODE_2839_length_972_cov_16_638800_g2227_i0NODE_2839_length_972_cov_16_638800_g2227_i0_p1_ORF_typecomplete_len119_score12_77DUF3005/PF11448_8/0_23_NODE_2839_length_972_cov_16_638800_g2227_i089445
MKVIGEEIPELTKDLFQIREEWGKRRCRLARGPWVITEVPDRLHLPHYLVFSMYVPLNSSADNKYSTQQMVMSGIECVLGEDAMWVGVVSGFSVPEGGKRVLADRKRHEEIHGMRSIL